MHEDKLQSVQEEKVVQRYVDILTNSGFKAFFGDANNREAVMSVLNVLLPEHRKIKSMEILATATVPSTHSEKKNPTTCSRKQL